MDDERDVALQCAAAPSSRAASDNAGRLRVLEKAGFQAVEERQLTTNGRIMSFSSCSRMWQW